MIPPSVWRVWTLVHACTRSSSSECDTPQQNKDHDQHATQCTRTVHTATQLTDTGSLPHARSAASRLSDSARSSPSHARTRPRRARLRATVVLAQGVSLEGGRERGSRAGRGDGSSRSTVYRCTYSRHHSIWTDPAGGRRHARKSRQFKAHAMTRSVRAFVRWASSWSSSSSTSSSASGASGLP